MSVNVITPQNTFGNISKYEYSSYLRDTIYYLEVPKSLTSEMLDYCDRIKTTSSKEWIDLTKSHLAGDLKQEYGITFLDNRSLYTNIYEFLREVITDIVKKPVIHFAIKSSWVNYQRANEANPTHNHSGQLSLVWYLNIPQVIREEHLHQESNGACRGLIQFLSSFTSEELLFNPKTSDMFIFDSSHRHQVYPFRSDVERVSFSCNIENIEVSGDI